MALKWGLADILRTHGQSWLETHPLSVQQAKAWRAIAACRTEALGGHLESCETCGTTRHVYHSCRNRHCPQCQTRAKEAWLAARQRELLPVPYFHLVFTLPHVLNALAGSDARTLYALLFSAVAETLTEFAAHPRWLGGTPSFTLVLHTWQQDLGRHLHLHALVAGGALTAQGDWVSAKRGFLFPVKALSRVYRGKFLAALESARQAGGLRHPSARSEEAWRMLRTALLRHDWVVYAKQPLGGPAQVLEYLGRYTHRVAISNERILGAEGGWVHFRVRGRDGKGKKVLRLEAGEFIIRRFLLHVLPAGFKRIRHYGVLGPAHKAEKLAAARAALDIPPPEAETVESVDAFMRRVAGFEWSRCPHCAKGRFAEVGAILPRPVCRALAQGPP